MVNAASSASLYKSWGDGERNFSVFYFDAVMIYWQCMHTTWYISVDTQLTFLAPPLVYLLWKFGKKASFLPVALISLSSAYTFYICYDRQFIADELVM